MKKLIAALLLTLSMGAGLSACAPADEGTTTEETAPAEGSE
jgi:hypothetical protein